MNGLFNKYQPFSFLLWLTCIWLASNYVWSDFIWAVTVKNQSFNSIRFRMAYSFLLNRWINIHLSTLEMDQGRSIDARFIYHCTACNIWTATKNRDQVTRCMRCSKSLKLMELEVCSIYVYFSALLWLSISLYRFKNTNFMQQMFVTEKRREKKTMDAHKTQLNAIRLASFETNILI